MRTGAELLSHGGQPFFSACEAHSCVLILRRVRPGSQLCTFSASLDEAALALPFYWFFYWIFYWTFWHTAQAAAARFDGASASSLEAA